MHWHDQRIAWLRLDPTVTVGLGEGWQVSAQVPFDVRDVSIVYTLPDATPYDPPYADIHHRDETIAGLTDGSLVVRKFAFVGMWLLGGGLGASLPLGRAEEDPFAFTEQGLTHQHVQLGSGTFVPMVTADAVRMGARWGFLASASARLPLYSNGEGYRPPTSVSGSLGPAFRPVKPVQLVLTAEAMHETPERWAGEPYGGRTSAVGALAALYTLSPDVVLQAQARATVWQAMSHHETDEGGSYEQPFVATAGVSWTFGASKPEDSAEP